MNRMPSVCVALVPAASGAAAQTTAVAGQDGTSVTVCGRVENIGCRDAKEVFLTLHRPLTGSPVSIVVPLREDVSIATLVENRFEQRRVCATGTIGRSDGVTQSVVVGSIDDIVVDAEASTAPAAFAPDAYRPCHPALTMPRLLRDVRPSYSPGAMRDGAEGSVLLRAVVQADGTVGELRMMRGVHPEHDERAVEAAKQWRFAAGEVAGKPVPVVVTIEMTFSLRGKK